MDFIGAVGKASDAGEDVIRRFGPDEGFRFFVMSLDEFANGTFKLDGAGVGAALDGALGEQCEPALDLIEPGAAGRGEVHMITRALRQPVPDHRAFVGGVIVDDQMNLELCRNLPVNAVKELAKFQAPMTTVTLTNYAAGFHIERGEQRGGAVAKVVRGAALDLAGPHRQDRLHPIEGLDLGLLVGAQDQGSLRWIKIKPDNVTHLLHQLRIGREFEAFAAMRAQAKGTPDAAHRGAVRPANLPAAGR